MRKHTITIYTNDELSLWDIMREINFEIDRKVFYRQNIRQRKFSGTWEEEVTSSSPLANRYGYRYETVAKWESVVVPNKEFIQFQKESN
tara:strand:- start:71 stop:337 length:267 start_codon:yes stop_codon:yes gene_type:complete